LPGLATANEITNTGKRFKLPGHPASVRMSTH
jgi:hypothetical protein